MLEHFFGSKTRLRLLKTFFRNPERPFYGRELARLINSQLNAVRRELANLEELGLIARAEVAIDPMIGGSERSKYYQLNQSFFLFEELRTLMTKAQVLEEREMIDEIKNKGGELALFMLTGLFTDEKEAATDMFLVGRVKPKVIARLIKKYETDSERAIRYTLMTEREFHERRTIGDKFLYSIFEAKNIMIVNKLNLNES